MTDKLSDSSLIFKTLTDSTSSLYVLVKNLQEENKLLKLQNKQLKDKLEESKSNTITTNETTVISIKCRANSESNKDYTKMNLAVIINYTKPESCNHQHTNECELRCIHIHDKECGYL